MAIKLGEVYVDSTENTYPINNYATGANIKININANGGETNYSSVYIDSASSSALLSAGR